jgi:hypothetical protein
VIGEHLFKFSYSTHTIKGRCVGGSINFEKPLLPLCLGELEQQFVSHDQICKSVLARAVVSAQMIEDAVHLFQ